jgi:hypothetical protein
MSASQTYRNNKDIILLLVPPLFIWLIRPLNYFVMQSGSAATGILQTISSFVTNPALMYASAIMSITAFVFTLLKATDETSRKEQHLRAFFLIAGFVLCLLSLFSLL